MTALKVETWPIGRLHGYARNPRKNDEDTLEKMVASIAEFGFRCPVVARSDGLIVDGHLRWAGAKKFGMTEIPVALADELTEAQVKAFRLLANRSATWAEFDKELLTLELLDLDGLGFDLGATGFDQDELDFFTGTEAEGGADPDDIPETPLHPVTVTGDVWCMGSHRLVCGDSTDAATVKLALNGVTPLLCVTDPPNGIDHDPEDRGRARNANGRALSTGGRRAITHEVTRSDWREAFDLFPGDVAYVWHAATNPAASQKMLEDAGFEIRQQIIWAKSSFVVSRGHYHMQHEPCQPAGTLVTKVVSPWSDDLGGEAKHYGRRTGELTREGPGRRASSLIDVPIETLEAGDRVVSFARGKIWRNGQPITKIGRREYSGNMHTVSVGDLCTRATTEHQFTIRFNPEARGKRIIYLMRSGDRWRVGTVALYNDYGFGLGNRIRRERAEAAWILSAHDDALSARVEEQAVSCLYGIPTTHWECQQEDIAQRTPDHIEQIYKRIGKDRLRKGVDRLFEDYGLDERYPIITTGVDYHFSCAKTSAFRSSNLLPGIMQIPVPTEGEAFDWRTISCVTFEHFSGPVYSMDVERDHHYVADGIVTHNCWYAVRKGKTANWKGDRKQSTVWQIDKQAKNMTGISSEKPVECMLKPIENNSSPGQAVYEPFAGSFTTGIACEMSGRSCVALETSPAAVDVGIKRWQTYSMQAAIHEASGKTFDELAVERPFAEAAAVEAALAAEEKPKRTRKRATA
jgi:DNA modification methylase